jgi:hypothetical protein
VRRQKHPLLSSPLTLPPLTLPDLFFLLLLEQRQLVLQELLLQLRL